jgi:uncharacterized spore protein YtfJ
MIDVKNKVLSIAEKTNEQLPSVLEKIFSAAQSDAVYSKPIVANNYTVITASEVASGGGFGSGSGFGPASPSSPETRLGEERSPAESISSGGGGMGGGGGSSGRPVAIIIIGPEGVSVKPIFDITKIALAGIAAWITMLTVLRGMRKVRKASKA